MDWEPFLAELEKNAALLPGKALEEIRLLRKKLPELLKGAVPDTDRAWQVFAVLMTVLVFVNMAYPDNAYAKGGYSSHSGSGGDGIDVSFFLQTERSPFHNPVFQSAQVTTLLLPSGNTRPVQAIRYKAPGAAAGPDGVKDDRLYFALTDDSFVSKDGELFFVLGQMKYLLHATPESFILQDKNLPEPLFEFYAEPGDLQAALGSMEQHIKSADKALASYDNWLAWARPAFLFSGEVRAQSREAKNIAEIRASLLKASESLQARRLLPPRPEIPAGWFRLAQGFYLADDQDLVLIDRSGSFFTYQYPEGRGSRYTVLPRRVAMDEFVNKVLMEKYLRTSAGDPRKAVFQSLLGITNTPAPAPPPTSYITPPAPPPTSLEMRAKPYLGDALK